MGDGTLRGQGVVCGASRLHASLLAPGGPRGAVLATGAFRARKAGRVLGLLLLPRMCDRGLGLLGPALSGPLRDTHRRGAPSSVAQWPLLSPGADTGDVRPARR